MKERKKVGKKEARKEGKKEKRKERTEENEIRAPRWVFFEAGGSECKSCA